jgi:hypothetical protein
VADPPLWGGCLLRRPGPVTCSVVWARWLTPTCLMGARLRQRSAAVLLCPLPCVLHVFFILDSRLTAATTPVLGPTGLRALVISVIYQACFFHFGLLLKEVCYGTPSQMVPPWSFFTYFVVNLLWVAGNSMFQHVFLNPQPIKT